MVNFQLSSSSNNNLLVNDNCEMMSKYKLRIRREKREKKITQDDTTKTERNGEIYTKTMGIVRSYWGL